MALGRRSPREEVGQYIYGTRLRSSPYPLSARFGSQKRRTGAMAVFRRQITPIDP
jgi:hypothetical protein